MHVNGSVQCSMVVLRLYTDYIATGAMEAHGKAAQHSTRYTYQRLPGESDFKLDSEKKKREVWRLR